MKYRNGKSKDSKMKVYLWLNS